MHLRVSCFRTGAANLTVPVGYEALSLGNWFKSSYTAILEDAITVLSLELRNQVIIDAASYSSNVTLLFFIGYSM
jgi:hypothetical protein